MNIEEYIASGILELYVAGSLSEEETQEVYQIIMKHPELQEEVLNIEKAILSLTAAVAPFESKYLFIYIKEKIGLNGPKIIPLNQKKLFRYTGWAASILLLGGFTWALIENNDIKNDLKIVEAQKENLELQIENASHNLNEAEQLIAVLRDRNIISIPLDGQAVFPEAYAKVYWDKKQNNIYLDAQGLPDPPKGKVYQVWSLTLNPLTPTSLGTIDNFTSDDNKIFSIENTNQSEAFGITLEPEGGSVSPTLEQLYTLGVLPTKP